MSKITIFISYKSEERDFAVEVFEKVKSWGHDVWIDFEGISSGAYFRVEIDAALRKSDFVLGIATPRALTSHEVQSEWDYALKKDNSCQLILLKYAETELTYHLDNLQYIDCTNDRKKSLAFEKLENRLQTVALQTSEHVESVTPMKPDFPDAYVDKDQTAPRGKMFYMIVAIVTVIASAFWFRTSPDFEPSIAFLGSITLISGAVIDWGFPKFKFPNNNKPTPREILIRKVKEYWIDGFLNNILNDGSSINTDLQLLPYAVLHYRQRELRSDFHPTADEIQRLFKDSHGELLILGEHGSGKTTLLLQLAKRLLNQAELTLDHPVPVILNLATWVEDQSDIDKWIFDECSRLYDISAKNIKTMLDEHEVIIILDGLDEISTKFLELCVIAINKFRVNYPYCEIVVACELKKYSDLTDKAGITIDLECALQLQSLDNHTIQEFLSAESKKHILSLVQHETAAKTLAKQPFMLNLMSFAYKDMSQVDLIEAEADLAQSERANDAFENYFRNKLRGNNLSNTAYRHLVWLANQMDKKNVELFFVEMLQSDWLNNDLERWYKVVTTVTLALISGIVVGGIITTIDSIRVGIVGFAIIAVMSIIIGGLGVLLSDRGVEVDPNLTGGLKLRHVVPLAGIGLFIGIFWQRLTNTQISVGLGSFSTIIILILGILFVLVDEGLRGQNTLAEKLRFNIRIPYLVSGLLMGLGLGFSISIFGGYIGGIAGGVLGIIFGTFSHSFSTDEDLDTRSRSSIGTRKAIKNFLLVLFVVTLIITIIVAYIVDIGSGIVIGISIGMGFGMIFGGGTSLVRYFLLRLFLSIESAVPIRSYSEELDSWVSTGVMAKIAGGYQFRHGLLQDYLSDQSDQIDQSIISKS